MEEVRNVQCFLIQFLNVREMSFLTVGSLSLTDQLEETKRQSLKGNPLTSLVVSREIFVDVTVTRGKTMTK